MQLIPATKAPGRTMVLATALLVSAATDSGAQAVPKAEYLPIGSFQLSDKGQPGAPDRPLALTISPDRTIHLVDDRGLVFVYDSTGLFQRTYGERLLDDPVAVQLRRNGESYVLDRGRKQVYVFGPGGQGLRAIGGKGSRGGQLSDPIDFALGPSGHVFVLDRGRGAVQVFSLDGTYVRDIPLGDDIRDPQSLAVARDGSVLVADARTPDRIYALPPFDEIPWAGLVPRGIAGQLTFRGAQLREPVATAVNELGTVVVLDNRTGRLFRKNLASRTDDIGPNDLLYGGIGTGRGSFREPVDVAFADRDELLILDRELRKVERIRLTTESGLPPLVEHGYPIRVTRVAKGLSAPLLDIGYVDGGLRFLLQVDDDAALVVGTQLEHDETVYGDSVAVYQPNPNALQLQIDRELGSAIAGVLSDTLILIADPRRDRFAVFAHPSGALIGTFGDNYRDNRRLRDPLGLALLPDGRIVVGDAGNDRLKIFSADLASLVASYPARRPAGIAVDPQGTVFVWNQDGTEVGRLNVEEGQLEPLEGGLLPNSVADLTFDHAGNLFVLDSESHRITIIDPELSRVLVQLGAERSMDRPTRIRVDRDGNIYVADEGSGRTFVFRWDVEVPGLAGLDLTYDGQVALLRWRTSPSAFVDGYEIQGADDPRGPYTAIARTDAPPYRLETERLATPPRYVRVAPVFITGVRGSPTEALPLSVFTASAAYERGDYDAAQQYAREGVRLIDSGVLEEDDRAKGRLLRVGFFSAYRTSDFVAALDWAKEAAAIPMPRDELVDFLFSLAEVYLRLGDPQKASQQLLALVAQDPSSEYYSDPQVIEQSFRVYRRLSDAGYPEDAVEFLRLYSRSIPSVAPEVRRQYADSITVYSTRARLAPGMRYWREASYGGVVNFFEGLLRQGGLTEEQMVVGSQLLAAAYYAFGNRVKAEDTFRVVFRARPGFDLEREIPRLERLYGLTIYNTQTRRFFGSLRGGP